MTSPLTPEILRVEALRQRAKKLRRRHDALLRACRRTMERLVRAEQEWGQAWREAGYPEKPGPQIVETVVLRGLFVAAGS